MKPTEIGFSLAILNKLDRESPNSVSTIIYYASFLSRENVIQAELETGQRESESVDPVDIACWYSSPMVGKC